VSSAVSPNSVEPELKEVVTYKTEDETIYFSAVISPKEKSFTLVEPEPKYNLLLSRLIANSPSANPDGTADPVPLFICIVLAIYYKY